MYSCSYASEGIQVVKKTVELVQWWYTRTITACPHALIPIFLCSCCIGQFVYLATGLISQKTNKTIALLSRSLNRDKMPYLVWSTMFYIRYILEVDGWV